MYLDEHRTVEEILRVALRSGRSEFRLSLAEKFRKHGYDAYAVSEAPRPDAPSVVVFRDPAYAVIYLFTEPAMNEAEFDVFRKEANRFAWDHGAAAYFVRLDCGTITRGTD